MEILSDLNTDDLNSDLVLSATQVKEQVNTMTRAMVAKIYTDSTLCQTSLSFVDFLDPNLDQGGHCCVLFLDLK